MTKSVKPPAKQEERQEPYLYVYGIIKQQGKNPTPKGLGGRQIIKINVRGISALASPYPVLYPILNEEEAMRHIEILKKIAHKTTIIPMSFGTVFKDKKILEIVLDKSYQAIEKTLALIRNKIELGVKVIKKPLDENELDEQEEIVQEIVNTLNKISVKSACGDKFSTRLLLNNSFLVEKNNFSCFSEKIAHLETKYPDLKFLYTGPWPPYSFVDINIKGG